MKFAAVVTTALLPGVLLGQNPPSDVQVYHGKPVRMFRLTENGVPSLREGTEIRLVRPVGTKVCLSVKNANQISYSYSIDATLDTTGNQLPKEWQKLASYLGISASGGDVRSAQDALSEIPTSVTAFLEKVKTVADEAQTVRKLADNATKPGVLNDASGAITDDGVFVAVAGFNDISKEEGHLRNDGVAAFIDKALAEALSSVRNRLDATATQRPLAEATKKTLDSTAKAVKSELDALKDPKKRAARQMELALAKANADAAQKDLADLERSDKVYHTWQYALPIVAGYAKTEVQAARRVIETYAKTNGAYKECKEVKDGRNTFSLGFARKDGITSDDRDFGDKAAIKVYVDAQYNRPVLELYPASFIVRHDDLSNYTISNGVLQVDEKSSKLEPRLGGMATITVFDRFNDLHSVAVSAGLGTNVIGGDDPVSELMLLGAISYRDLFRVGLGWGYLPSKKLKDGIAVGSSVPTGSKLSDLFVTQRVWEFAIMFSMTGAKLAVGK